MITRVIIGLLIVNLLLSFFILYRKKESYIISPLPGNIPMVTRPTRSP